MIGRTDEIRHLGIMELDLDLVLRRAKLIPETARVERVFVEQHISGCVVKAVVDHADLYPTRHGMVIPIVTAIIDENGFKEWDRR